MKVIKWDQIAVWNFTLIPNEFTILHTHVRDYYFVVTQPSVLEVYNYNCEALFNFTSDLGVMGFKLKEDELIPIDKDIILQYVLPKTHAAKNVGNNIYNEILIELKLPLNSNNYKLPRALFL